MSTSNSPTFCPLPFAHTTILTNGTYQICCQHQSVPKEQQLNINKVPLEHWKNSNYVNEVKNSFLTDQKHPGCSACWDQESINQTSYRQRVLDDYSMFKVDPNFDELINVEIQLGNLCNLTCLMCNEQESSAILAENKKLGINLVQQKDFSWNDTSFDHLNQILNTGPKIITIRGGEPLYNKKLLKLIEELPDQICKKTVLHITTNATIWSEQWARAIKKFGLVRFMFSVDATERLYEYMRFPGDWNLVETNIKQIIQLDNVKSLVYCVVQNLNISNISNIIKWSQQHNIWLTLVQISVPDYLSITNLPTHLKHQALDHLEQCLLIPNLADHLIQFIQICRTQLKQSLLMDADATLWEQCLNYLNTRDQIRNNSHKQFLIY